MSVEVPTTSVDELERIDKDEDKYEERVVILELNGVLDGESVRQAARNSQLVVRKPNDNAPIIQIGSSVYTGKWCQTIGTDMIFQASDKIVQTNPAMTGNTDFELSDSLFQQSFTSSQLDLISYSDTRLIAQKALISTGSNAKSTDQETKTTIEESTLVDAVKSLNSKIKTRASTKMKS